MCALPVAFGSEPARTWLDTVPTTATTTCEPAGSLHSTEPLSLAVFLLIGLLGGAHCLGMCGPLVATYADRMREDERRGDDLTVRQVRQHALFNLGRTASYAAIGGLFGAAGSIAFVSGRAVTTLADEVHAFAGLLVGGVIVAIGVRYALRLELDSLPVPGVERLSRAVTERITRASTHGSAIGAYSDSAPPTVSSRVHCCIRRSSTPSSREARPAEPSRSGRSASEPFRRCSSSGRCFIVIIAITFVITSQISVFQAV